VLFLTFSEKNRYQIPQQFILGAKSKILRV
jgi:hypothetical protein